MKLIKLMLAIIMALTMVAAQDENMGPPPFGDVDTSGDGMIDREEARAFFGEEPDFDATFDKHAGEDGMVDPAEYEAASQMEEGEHKLYCSECDMEFATEEEMHQHMEEVHGAGPPGDHTGFYCADCEMEFATEEEMHQHMEEVHGGGHPAPNNHWDGNCGALCSGHGEYWLDADGDGNAEDGPYATWTHDADGNEVNCDCGGQGGPPPSFEEMDANNDGGIDREEARTFFGEDPNFDAEFDRVDTNGDGTVDQAEYDAEAQMQSQGGNN